MSTPHTTKINQLLASQPPGVVFQASWLAGRGYSPELQKRYRMSQWLTSIGTGAMIRAGDHVGYEGGVFALQHQGELTIHPGGRTAMALTGRAQYLDLKPMSVTLFGGTKEKLPAWFRTHDWGLGVNYYATSFLPRDLGLIDVPVPQKEFSIKVSSAARAVLECLYLAPEEQDLAECYQFMEGLNNLRPDTVQTLLEKCRSVKVKRLFLYMAERAGHDWFSQLDTKRLDLGQGKSSIVKQGVYVPKYQITVPKEFAAHGPGRL